MIASAGLIGVVIATIGLSGLPIMLRGFDAVAPPPARSTSGQDRGPTQLIPVTNAIEALNSKLRRAPQPSATRSTWQSGWRAPCRAMRSASAPSGYCTRCSVALRVWSARVSREALLLRRSSARFGDDPARCQSDRGVDLTRGDEGGRQDGGNRLTECCDRGSVLSGDLYVCLTSGVPTWRPNFFVRNA
jgi:hypothetical protein